ncbi:hypothetical protein EDD18DRAFT_1109566 [Armillaria luteobubalina]|uniref:Hydrophobin n=1 Tax=Armillaria luteobubalina TaxID=153913 RepID=A0AA39PWF2_9AGAR|nr:hypothetical protein EDD18DRAFT_1109566 [Armillaria luteobubalina]
MMFKQALALLPFYLMLCAAAPSPKAAETLDARASCNVYCCTKVTYGYTAIPLATASAQSVALVLLTILKIVLVAATWNIKLPVLHSHNITYRNEETVIKIKSSEKHRTFG